MYKLIITHRRELILGLIVAGCLAVPLLGEIFYTRLATRILIYGLCALSLDLILGFGGMVSLGHAAFLGMGAYFTGILSFHGVSSAFVAWPVAVALTAVVAGCIGTISLRTTGSYFIMITLAFAQMLFYFFSSLGSYGGDDGMALWSRNSLGWIDLASHTQFYYLVAGILIGILFLASRLTRSPFGAALVGIRENERKMQALGYPVFRYKLMAFIIAACVAALAGVLLANHEKYVSPALMHWTRSAEILVMVILGGMGTLRGPILGAAALLLAEEVLSGITQHWMVFLGPLLIGVVLYAKGGIYSLLPGDSSETPSSGKSRGNSRD